MELQLVCSAPQVEVYFDSCNDWLYVDWTGEITLPVVQAACVQIAHCFLARPYARVLNNNTQVTGISWNIAPWLIGNFLPHLRLAGVEQLAWVCSPSLPGLSMVQAVVTWLPHLAIAVFDDVEDGAAWLHRGRRASDNKYPYATRSVVMQQQLELAAQELAQQLGIDSLLKDKAA
jgi:hypothetical protein